MTIIGTISNFRDFQSILFKLEGLTWNEFCDKLINEEEYIHYVIQTSMDFGSTTRRLYRGRVVKIDVKDDKHIRLFYENGHIASYYLL